MYSLLSYIILFPYPDPELGRPRRSALPGRLCRLNSNSNNSNGISNDK